MKTLEERAKEAWDNYEYREGNLYQSCFIDGFVAGWEACLDHLSHIPWDKAIEAIAGGLSEKENK